MQDPSPPPCGACADRRRERHEWDRSQADSAAEATRARRAAIDACARCDANGWREAGDGAVARCGHGEAGEAA